MYISGEFKHFGFVWFMVFNATFNNISVISWLLMVPQGRHVYDRMEVGFTTTCAISTLVSSINKTDRHDITEILLTVALNTITLTLLHHIVNFVH